MSVEPIRPTIRLECIAFALSLMDIEARRERIVSRAHEGANRRQWRDAQK